MRLASNLCKVVVAGTGSIGMRHLSVLKEIGGVCPIALPKRKERLLELKTNGFVTASSLSEAVSLGASLCIVATDTVHHVEDGLLALDLGLDVLMEKPMATNAQSARILVQRAKEKKLQFFVGCNLRFSESLTLFREQLSQIGPIHSVFIECRSYLPDWRPGHPYQDSYSARREEGGVLLDLIHDIDYAGWIFGWPKTLQGYLKNLGRLGIEAEEMAHLFWETEGGAFVSISLDYLSRIPRRRMRAMGAFGHIEWDGIGNHVLLERVGEQSQKFSSTQSRNQMMLKQTQAFLNARQDGGSGPLATAEEGVLTLTVCDLARKSSRSFFGKRDH